MDGGRLDDWTESLSKVHTGALGEATENPTRLVPLKRSINIELVFEDPLPGDHVGA